MKKAFLVVLFGIIISSAHQFPAWAVDTNECFSVGAFTDYEIYGSMGFGAEGVGGGMEFLVGGGITENFSYLVTTDVWVLGKEVELGSIGLGFLWTAVDLEKFAFDIMPGISFDANSSDGNLSYPGFDAFTASLNLEFNCMALQSFQPYLLAGFEGSYDYRSDDDSSYAFPLAVGAMFPVKEKIEFLMQFGWTPTDEDAWKDTDREIAVGVNGMATEELEVISQVGYEFNAKDFGVTLGLIYAW